MPVAGVVAGAGRGGAETPARVRAAAAAAAAAQDQGTALSTTSPVSTAPACLWEGRG